MTKKRVIGVWALIVVASILLIGTTTSLWVKRQALDTTNWVNAADEALDDPAVQDALATYIVDQLYANVNVAQELSNQLPENLQGIAGPIAAGLRQPATIAVEKLLQTNAVQKVWHDANRVAHQKLVDVLEDKGVVDLYALQYAAPSVTISGYGSANVFTIRGLGRSQVDIDVPSGVVIYRDGAPTLAGYFQNEPYFDMKSVEVFRGPQGTFVGKNAAGGAVFISTNDPELGHFNGSVEGRSLYSW